MKLVLKDTHKTELFVHLCKNLHQICDSMTLQFNDDHLYIQSMDSNHICMIEVRLDDVWFDDYEKDESDASTIGINTNILQMILKCKHSSQHLTMTYEDDPDTLHIAFQEGGKDEFDKEFEMPLMDLDQDVLSIPSDAQWETEFDFKSTVFQHLMSEMEMFNDTISLRCTEEDFQLSASGENGKYKVKFNIDDLESYAIDEDTEVSTSYSVKYFTMISSFSKLSKMLNVEASNNMPIKLTYNLGADGDEDNYMKFYLAPKMEDF